MIYSKERKEAILKKMMPPENKSVTQISQEEGIPPNTLYNWRNKARQNGKLLPDGEKNPEGCSTQNKFAAVIETSSMNEAELAEYYRKRGIYPSQVKAWRSACENANDWDNTTQKNFVNLLKMSKSKLKNLSVSWSERTKH